MSVTLVDAVPAPERAENEYAHLAPLFTERARLAPDDPRREKLRAELITGYLPVARNIAHRFVHRGDIPDDLEQVAHGRADRRGRPLRAGPRHRLPVVRRTHDHR